MARTKVVQNRKSIEYKIITKFSYLVVIQLFCLVHEEFIVTNTLHFPIWGLLFLLYGPYLYLLIFSAVNHTNALKHSIYLGDFYSTGCVFVGSLFLAFTQQIFSYSYEVLFFVLFSSHIFYGIKISKIVNKQVIKQNVLYICGKNNRWIWLNFFLLSVLVALFYFLIQDVKLTVFLFLFFFYLYLVLIRKMMMHISSANYNLPEQLEQYQEDALIKIHSTDHLNRKPNLEQDSLKYGKTKLNDVVLQRCNRKVMQIIVENKAFLNADFKMTDLADQTNISRYYLAQYFTVVHQMNFREYINTLRIDYVVQYIKEYESKDSLSVNELFIESAFNSKTSFFKSFKRVLGCTPFEYLKSNTTNSFDKERVDTETIVNF